jgi:hypothetical protein
VGEGIIVPFSGGFTGLFIIASGYFSRLSRASSSIFLVAPTGSDRGLVTCPSPSLPTQSYGVMDTMSSLGEPHVADKDCLNKVVCCCYVIHHLIYYFIAM